MIQKQLPIFPDGVTLITSELAFQKKDGKVTYFNGHMPVFVHDEDDIRTFRMITAQFCVNGNAKQADIARAFGIPLITMKRAVKRYRESGPSGFYQEPARRGATVLIPTVLSEAQGLLDDGVSVSEIAEKLNLKVDTLRKAITEKRLHNPQKKKIIKDVKM